MARTPQQKSTSLADLSKNKIVFSKVITMLDKGTSYDLILEYLESKDMKIAKGSLTNLKKKLEESRDLSIPIEELLDRRTKKSIKDVPQDKVIGYIGGSDGLNDFYSGDAQPQQGEVMSVGEINAPMTTTQMQNKFYNMDDVLDKFIQKGYNTLMTTEFVDLNLLLKAMDLYAKTHDVAKTGGLSLNALKQYQILSEAKIKALIEVVLEYIPEDMQDQVLNEMENAEREFIANIEVAPEGKDLLSALRKAGVDL